jgi:hypothetical protein
MIPPPPPRRLVESPPTMPISPLRTDRSDPSLEASPPAGPLQRGLGGVALLLPVAALAAATIAGGPARVAVPPSPLALLAALVAAAGAIGMGGRRSRPWLDLPLAALFGVAAAHVFFRPGIPFGHDTLSHLWGSWTMAYEVAGGDLYPRWLHHLQLGTPLLHFYGPLGYYALLPFAALGLGWPHVLSAGFVLFGAVAGVTMYLGAGAWLHDRRAALLAAAAYTFAPYRLLDANYRMALGETAALAILPLVLLAATRRARGRGSMVGPAVAIAALLLTHPLTAMLAAGGHGVWLVADAAMTRAGRRALARRATRLAAAWLLGAALAGFFVVPLAAELGFTSVSFERPASLADHALAPGQILARRQWDSLELAAARGDARHEKMPLYVGAVLLALLPLAAGAGSLPGEGRRRFRRHGVLPAGLGMVVAVGLLVPLDPLPGLLERVVPSLSLLQFPWRLLTLASCGAAAAAGLAAARLLALRRPLGVLLATVMLALLLWDATPYAGAADLLPPHHGAAAMRRDASCLGGGCWTLETLPADGLLRVAGFVVPPDDLATDVDLVCCAFPEFTNPAARRAFVPEVDGRRLARSGAALLVLPEEPPHPLEAAPLATWHRGRDEPPAPRSFSRGGGRIRVELDGRPGTVVVHEQYFPGWQVRTADGWREVEPTRSGLLKAEVGSGQREALFRFDGWRWDRALGVAVSAAAMTVLVGIVVAGPLRRRRSGLSMTPGR